MNYFKKNTPIFCLLLLAPWIGEYLVGNVPASLLWAFPFLIPLYGGGALLIREAARATGKGYSTILLLGMAYGVIEAGLVDQSLFNANFEGHNFQSESYIPLFGISAYHAMTFIFGHAIWSITIPIAITEMLLPSRSTTPWLGTKGWVATVLLYLLGCWLIFQDLQEREAFLAAPMQLIGAGSLALLCIAIAFIVKERTVRSDGWVPKPRLLGIGTFMVANAYALRPEDWTGVFLGLFILMAGTFLLIRWSQQQGWSIQHHFALVAGTLPVYMWNGFLLTYLVRPDDTIAWIGNSVFALIAIFLLVVTAKIINPKVH